VTLVPLDVRVLDRNGRPVTDLTKGDFAVTEDGVPQPISHFERQALMAGQPDAGIPLVLGTTRTLNLTPQDRRVFLLALGRRWLPGDNFGLADAIMRFLRERLLPQDYAAVSAYDRVTDVTTDHDAVAQVVDRLRAYQKSSQQGPGWQAKFRALLNITVMPPAMQAELDAIFEPGTSRVRSLPRVTSSEIAGLLSRIEDHAAGEANFIFEPTARYTPGLGDLRDAQARGIALGDTSTVRSLFSAIRYLRYIEGEKHLIYFSWVRVPALEDDRDLARLASDARMVIHVIPGAGPSTLRYRPVIEAFGPMSSKHVAELTGGQAFLSQEPDRALAHIDQATRVGYLLGYYPSNAALDGRYRTVTVKVKRPPGATVLYRRSYQATDELAPVDRQTFIVQDRIMSAGEYEAEIRDIPLTLKVSTKKGAVAAEVRVELSRLDLEEADGRHTGKFEAAFFCADSKERLIGQAWQTVDLNLKEETYQRLLTEGLRHASDIPITGSARYVKVVVYDYRADRLGSAIVRLQ
jgi:VWFA-related protein